MAKLRDVAPLGHRILVKLKKLDEELEVLSPGGLIVEFKTKSDLEREQIAHIEAYVVEIGPTAGKYLDNHEGKGELGYGVGDLVLIGRYAGTDVPGIEENEVYRLLKDNDVQAKFRGE
ncbi:GroES chaperonin family [uncultured Caudovirales phage]|uniref:GroES chaperonin family n=1 Tax=uncultured Caudovirales phage TaxID=2100421 RepID=A0A6J5KHH6_9CAUD|nr:GroES chaperonin family [uncultured Caudovirales phage]